MRLDLIVMKDEILKVDLNPACANFATVLELQAVSEVQCSSKARPQKSALPYTMEGSNIYIYVIIPLRVLVNQI